MNVNGGMRDMNEFVCERCYFRTANICRTIYRKKKIEPFFFWFLFAV